MNKLNNININELVPEGLVVNRKSLLTTGLTKHQLDNMVKSGELEFVARGVYRRSGPPLKWQAVVISLQGKGMGNLELAVGGISALALHGVSHYLRFGTDQVHLYGVGHVPAWVSKVCLSAEFIHHGGNLFHGAKAVQKTELINRNTIKVSKMDSPFLQGRTSQPWGTWDWPLIISTVERAVLEVLSGVPNECSFEEADMLMQGMVNLSPRRLAYILKDCKSIKTKRLFFWFAERHNHSWLKHLDHNEYDLGSGKRVLAKGGKLDKKYQITVPKEMYG